MAKFSARAEQLSAESHERHVRRAARKRAARLVACSTCTGAVRSAALAAPRALAFGSRAGRSAQAPLLNRRPSAAQPRFRSAAGAAALTPLREAVAVSASRLPPQPLRSAAHRRRGSRPERVNG
ncbi:MAG: hypothetical protein JOZ54_14915 [Acidobacteria bacterium]|nr:hypothetical protein [Acidobacteriota bacterium]